MIVTVMVMMMGLEYSNDLLKYARNSIANGKVFPAW
jgi:hypothetical protein